MFSLSCGAGQSRAPDDKGHRLGFAEGVIAYGAAGVVLAPLGDTLHENSRVLARALVQTLTDGRRSLREILDAARSYGASLKGYTVIGDPALRAVSAPGAWRRGERVFAPAADTDLAPKIVDSA
jgi:hypothetical protein